MNYLSITIQEFGIIAAAFSSIVVAICNIGLFYKQYLQSINEKKERKQLNQPKFKIKTINDFATVVTLKNEGPEYIQIDDVKVLFFSKMRFNNESKEDVYIPFTSSSATYLSCNEYDYKLECNNFEEELAGINHSVDNDKEIEGVTFLNSMLVKLTYTDMFNEKHTIYYNEYQRVPESVVKDIVKKANKVFGEIKYKVSDSYYDISTSNYKKIKEILVEKGLISKKAHNS